MLSLPGYDTSGFKIIPQLSSGKTKHKAFNFSPLRASCDCKRLRQTPASRAKHNAALPISQIPIELLCNIFLKFLEDDREFPDYTSVTGPLVSFHSRADPTIFGQVCSWWRSVALSTPALWANLFILEPKRTQISRTRLWLHRAGNNPLNIAIRDTRKEECDLTSFDEILSTLASRRQFWRKVNFLLPNVALETLAIAITKQPANFQNLESASLCIGYQQPFQKVSVDAIWKAFHSSPVLHEVDWRGAYFNKLPTHAPWAQLTHLSLLSEFSVESLLDILVSCPRIHVLFIFRLSLPCETREPLEPIFLNCLHKLTLEAEVETGPFFDRLTLPSLRSLDISHRDENLSGDSVAFQEFLRRSNCFLERFVFHDENLEEDHLHAYITSSYLRNVTVLDLQVPISDKIIQSLTRQTNDGYLEVMPFLEEMSISVCTSSDGLLAQMASSRWSDLSADKIRKTLKRITLHKDGNYGLEDKLGLSKLFKSGLQGFKS